MSEKSDAATTTEDIKVFPFYLRVLGNLIGYFVGKVL